MLNKLFFYLLLFIPVTIILTWFALPPVWLFFLSALGIIPLAKFLGQATEELSTHTGSALGGLLNATFGNATELIIGIFALRAGLVEVVKASITGSIIGNLLLVLGVAMVAGGSYYKKQKFNRTAVLASASSLLLATIALTIPAIFFQTTTSAQNVTEELSIFVAVFMIIAYFASLWFALFTHRHLYTEEVGKHEPQWSVGKSLLVLAGATIFIAWLSEILVGSITPIVETFGWSQLFIGVIFVAIIGNAAEHASAVLMAVKNRMDLALQIAIGSATQIAMFVAPILVLVSLLFVHQMNLIFSTFELIAIVLSVLISNFVVADGESNWLEGLQLLMAYAIIAVGFFFYR